LATRSGVVTRSYKETRSKHVSPIKDSSELKFDVYSEEHSSDICAPMSSQGSDQKL
jgi:hypothetical protein